MKLTFSFIFLLMVFSFVPTAIAVTSTPFEQHDQTCYLLHPPNQDLPLGSAPAPIYHPYTSGGGYYEYPSTAASTDLFTASANMLSSVLPSSPENMRIATLISNFGGQGSLAGNLALELYTAIWQFLALMAAIGFYKLIPGKLT